MSYMFDTSLGLRAEEACIKAVEFAKKDVKPVLMETAWQLALRDVSASLLWIPRAQNTEADALTKRGV
jgi:hypothetical protein